MHQAGIKRHCPLGTHNTPSPSVRATSGSACGPVPPPQSQPKLPARDGRGEQLLVISLNCRSFFICSFLPSSRPLSGAERASAILGKEMEVGRGMATMLCRREDRLVWVARVVCWKWCLASFRRLLGMVFLGFRKTILCSEGNVGSFAPK
ncbi:hypothetical protein AVEN_172329-1 [Araneus ventricosus]|uniref:Uncharacterized protein n=1 Tax=Araneus ventricosus TaxID=182803 RepID=A0A4Y2E1Y5_ARAVE|nr:hypothetical protein AVEN_172329-1 [Araneus ventricosus]